MPEAWYKPKWTIEPVFKELRFLAQGMMCEMEYNSLLLEPAGNAYCVPPLRDRLVNGKRVVPDEVFEELPPDGYIDWGQHDFEWADVNPDDPDDTG
ncbi:MAG: hypothetical protein ACYCUV_01800 [Phycisphaerae bacterium]